MSIQQRVNDCFTFIRRHLRHLDSRWKLPLSAENIHSHLIFVLKLTCCSIKWKQTASVKNKPQISCAQNVWERSQDYLFENESQSNPSTRKDKYKSLLWDCSHLRNAYGRERKSLALSRHLQYHPLLSLSCRQLLTENRQILIMIGNALSIGIVQNDKVSVGLDWIIMRRWIMDRRDPWSHEVTSIRVDHQGIAPVTKDRLKVIRFWSDRDPISAHGQLMTRSLTLIKSRLTSKQPVLTFMVFLSLG